MENLPDEECDRLILLYVEKIEKSSNKKEKKWLRNQLQNIITSKIEKGFQNLSPIMK